MRVRGGQSGSHGVMRKAGTMLPEWSASLLPNTSHSPHIYTQIHTTNGPHIYTQIHTTHGPHIYTQVHSVMIWRVQCENLGHHEADLQSHLKRCNYTGSNIASSLVSTSTVLCYDMSASPTF